MLTRCIAGQLAGLRRRGHRLHCRLHSNASAWHASRQHGCCSGHTARTELPGGLLGSHEVRHPGAQRLGRRIRLCGGQALLCHLPWLALLHQPAHMSQMYQTYQDIDY